MSQGSNKKNDSHIGTPTKKAQRACAAEADAGGMHGEGRDGRRGNGDGSNAGSSSSPSIFHRISSGVGVLAVGGVVAKVRTGQDTAKKRSTYFEGESDGRRHVRQYGIGDRGDAGRCNWSGTWQ